MKFNFSPKTCTMIAIILIFIEIFHIVFTVWSYVTLRNKTFTACKKGEYRGI
jgi:hypothetical protein